MLELSRYLFVAGALPILLLGLAHAWETPLRADQVKGLSPADADLARAMSRTTVVLTRRTDMWRAWVGFNLSHSLGAVLFGLTVLLIGRSPSSFAAQGALFGPLAVAVSGVYLVLGVKYWFRTPIAGCGLSTALFLASWLLGLGRP